MPNNLQFDASTEWSGGQIYNSKEVQLNPRDLKNTLFGSQSLQITILLLYNVLGRIAI